MADGKTHDRAIWLTTPAVGLAAWAIAPTYAAPVTIAHLWGGLLLSPDLDTRSRPYKRWGLLRFFWLPYQKTMKHRGWSHALIFGTLGRVGYLLAPVLIAALLNGVSPEAIAMLAAEHWRTLAAIGVGLELSAIVHLKLDGIL